MAANPAIGSGCTHRLGAADDDHVGAVEAEQVQAPADRLGARRAGADRGVHPGLGADGQAHGGGRAVGHEHRDGEGGDPLGALLLQDVVLAEQGQGAADAGAEDDGDAQRVDPGVGAAGVAPGLLGGDDGDLLAAVEPAGAHPVQLLGRLDGEAGDELGGQSLTQSSVIRLTPDRPASSASQVEATSPPRGVVAPSPVTTMSAVGVLMDVPSWDGAGRRSAAGRCGGLDQPWFFSM